MKKQFYIQHLSTVLLILYAGYTKAQLISTDSRGKDVLEFYQAASLKSSFIPASGSLQLGYTIPLKSSFFYVGNKSNKTVAVSRGISLAAKMSNSVPSSDAPFSFNTKITRPAFRLELGYQRMIDTFYDIVNTNTRNKFTYTAGITGYIEFQNLNFYDIATKTETAKKPVFVGMHGQMSFFKTHTGKFAVSVSGDISKSYNQDGLTPYAKHNSTDYIDDNIIALGDAVGNIGTYKAVDAYRLRISVPYFFTKWLNIMPYFAVFGNTNSSRQVNPGLTLNLFGGSPAKKNGALSQGFGFGIDWVNKTKWSSPNYFLYGSLDFSFFKRERKGKPE